MPARTARVSGMCGRSLQENTPLLERHLAVWRRQHPWLEWDLLVRGSDWPQKDTGLAGCTSQEMELKLGLPKDYSLAILSKKDRPLFKAELEFLRNSKVCCVSA
eukprot:1234300-Amphidinium_carterae.2